MTTSVPSVAFMRQLHRALHHLYVPAELRSNPLLDTFEIDPREGPSGLRRILLEAIEALRPAASVPKRARPWRTYLILLYLYVRQFSQAEVATAFALSTRQLRRQEREARQALAEHLWTRYGLHSKGLPEVALPVALKAAADGTPSREQELAWLERSVAAEPADLARLLEAAASTAAPLTAALGVSLEWAVPPGLPRAMVQVASMRQALLNALMATIQHCPGARVQIEAGARRGELWVRFRPAELGIGGVALDGQQIADRLELARRLVALSGGQLRTRLEGDEGQDFHLELAVPAAGQVTVLAIDDNADTLQLFQRYLVGSRYPFLAARSAEQGLSFVAEARPQIIVLDVMLPDVDGWEALGRLRAHPNTQGVPIIVCSILAEEELALALGAAGFLRKPVSRAEFLATLDRQAGLLSARPG